MSRMHNPAHPGEVLREYLPENLDALQFPMIKSFQHKGLETFFRRGKNWESNRITLRSCGSCSRHWTTRRSRVI